ncbi:MAG: LCCL domain-containing protein [Planctomycetaceae bacterium]
MMSFDGLQSVRRLSTVSAVLCLLIGVSQSASGQSQAPPTIPPAASPPSLERLAPDRATTPDYLEVTEEPGSEPAPASLPNQPVASVVEMRVTGSTSGAVWGTTVYTSDSDVATAAVHAGVLKDGESGRIKITVLPGRDSYEATVRHGVASRDYGSWGKSFWIESLPQPKEDDSPADQTVAATPVSTYRGQHGYVVKMRVTGRTTGPLWGTEVYTDDSDVATAAVHSSILQPGQTGTVRVTVLPGRSGYRGSHHHGVTSSPYGAWHGSFWVDHPWYDPHDRHRHLHGH